MSLLLRAMRHADIDQVVAIDEQCFRPPWPKRSWRVELAASHSHMLVLSEGSLPREQGWRSRLRIPGRRLPAERVLGYGGMWLVADEGHISTLATHPQHRGQGYGELLLSALIRRALARRASLIVLEVRESNRVARDLYQKYGFQLFGIKSRYYREGNEDACDMRLDMNDPAACRMVQQRSSAIHLRLAHADRFSPALQPVRR